MSSLSFDVKQSIVPIALTPWAFFVFPNDFLELFFFWLSFFILLKLLKMSCGSCMN